MKNFFLAVFFLAAFAGPLAAAGPDNASRRIDGLRPPTPEEKAYLRDRIQRVDSLLPNAYAFRRAALESGFSRAPDAALAPGLPSAAKNLRYLPRVGDQGALGSCTAWAACYYYKTYQEAREHGWERPDPASSPDKVMSPSFCYNLANKGEDKGAPLATLRTASFFCLYAAVIQKQFSHRLSEESFSLAAAPESKNSALLVLSPQGIHLQAG